MGKQGDRFIIILDIDKVFSVDELILVNDVSGVDSTEQAPEPEPDKVTEEATVLRIEN